MNERRARLGNLSGSVEQPPRLFTDCRKHPIRAVSRAGGRARAAHTVAWQGAVRSGARRLPAVLAAAALAAAGVVLAGEAPGQAAPGSELSLWGYMFRGVGGVVEAVILLCSVCMLALTADYFSGIRLSRHVPAAVLALCRQEARRGEFHELLEVCEENPCLLTRVLERGLLHVKYGREGMREAVTEALEKDAARLHDRIGYLAFLSNVTPMLGLLGTVVGMIGAFSKIGFADAAGRFAVLAGDIAIALITTATGLLVAIPAMFVFFFFRNRINAIVLECDTAVMSLLEEVLRHLSERKE